MSPKTFIMILNHHLFPVGIEEFLHLSLKTESHKLVEKWGLNEV